MKFIAVLAHPDDEIIFGWPIFQHRHLNKHLICATGGEKRLKALQESSKFLHFTWECLNLPDGEVMAHPKIIQDKLRVHLDSESVVFTHNPHGEYSHPDHMAIFHAVKSVKEIKTLLITDMSISLHGSGFPETPLQIPDREKAEYYGNCLCEQTRIDTIYGMVQDIYKGYKSWTWGKRHIDSARLFFVKQENHNRKYIIELLSALLCSSECKIAEIGVYKGQTTEYLARSSHISKIYAIDPWKNIDTYNDHKKLLRSIKKHNQGESINASSWDGLYQHVLKKLNFPHVEIIRKTSVEAAVNFNYELDLVFLDGDHSYNSVLQDLELWVPKIKSGGIIIGHDYTWTQDNGDKKGLVKAVLKYFNDNKSMFHPPLNPSRNPVINRQTDRIWWQRKK